MTDLITWVCHECGSSSLWAMGSIKWDINLQLWVSDHPDDGCDVWCTECDHNGMEVERPLNFKEIAQLAIKKQEKLNASNAQ